MRNSLKTLIISLCLASWASGAMAAGIKVVPSAARVSPGETFSVDIIAEGIPSEGLGTVQFRLNVNAAGGNIAGVSDLIQAKSGDISVSTPLQISSPSSTRSGLGDFFWNGRSSHGVLVMDNEPLNNGSALYTYAHTNGATLPVGGGTVARFQFSVGSAVEAENINISLSDVMLLDGGTEYPLEYNNGATVQLRCMTTTPSLLGLTLSEAKTALEGANLTLGNVYEISNNGSRSVNAVLEQSSQSGASVLCQTPVDIAINTAPTDVTQATAADKAGDDTGGVILSWLPSSSTDIAGYKVYSSSTLLKTINVPSATGTEIGGLTNGTATQLRVTAYDTYGNESQGVTIQATALDDVPPVITVEGVQEGSYYSIDVTPVVNVFDNHLSTKTVTLNNTAYNSTAITSEGSYTLSIAATDLSGNHSSKTISFAVDKTPPAIAITGIEEGRYYNVDLLPVVTVSDTNLNEKMVTLNGQPYNGASITAEGSYTLTVNAVDVVGHASSETRNFHIDKTAPVSVNVIGSPKVEDGGSIFVTGSTPVALSASDSGTVSSGVNRTEYSIDSAAIWNIYSNGISLSNAADGLHSISYKSADNATNIETAKQISVTVDNGTPITAITVGEPKFQAQDGSFFITQGTAFTLSASDTYSGVSRTEYRLNNGQWTAYAPFNLSNEGTYHIEYRSADKLGNTETSKSLSAIVDNTPPVTTHSIGTPKYTTSGNTNYITGNTVITLAAEDASSGVAVTEYRVDGGAWTTYAPITIQAEGNHQIEYRSKDRTGNVEETKSVSVTVDNTPPVTNITTGTPNYTAQDGRIFVTSSTRFTLSSTDSGSGVKGTEYRIDGGTWTSYASFTLQVSGSHLIEYRAIDNVDNTEATKSLAVIVDDAPPVTEITATGARHISAAGVIYVTRDTAFTLTASDDLSGVAKTEYKIDNGAWTAYAPFAVNGEGEHTISYRSADNLGNLEGAKVYTVIVDNMPPISEMTVGSPKHTDSSGTLFITGETTMTITASDSSSGVAHTDYRVDGGQWQAYEPFRISTEGHHVIEYRSADNVANTEEPKNLSATIDNTPPTTEISVGAPKFTSTGGVLYVTGGTAFTLTASDNLSGVEKTEYRIDGGEWHASAPFTISAEGSHLIEYRSADNVGNLENIRSLSAVVDNTPPVSTLTLGTPKYDANGSIYVNGSTTFTLSASDALSGVKGMEYRIDNGQWTEYTAAFSLSTLYDGQHTIYYRASDNVGNIEPEKAVSFIIDNTPPETAVTISSPKFTGTNGSLYVTKDTVFTLASTDNLSGVKSTEYRIDGSAWTSETSFSVSEEGTHSVAYRSKDNVENLETEMSINIIVDNTPPVSTVEFSQQNYIDGQNILVSRNTQVILSATDNLSGVKGTYYRFDDEDGWRTYTGAFRLTDLTFGTHTIRYRSSDNVENTETEKSVTVVLVGIDVKTDVMNLPRVLVWTRDPSKIPGNNKPTYTLDDIKNFISGALNDKDIYFKTTTDKDEFINEFRSGIYNMAAVIDQDTPFDAVFLREMREAVNRGMGLMISGWGNTTPPILEEALGVQVSGSLNTTDADRTIYLYQGPVSPEQSLTAKGKILKTSLTTGTLSGIVKGEEACDGVKGVSFKYQTSLMSGDTVKTLLYTPSGKKLTLVDEETLSVDSLPSDGVNSYAGNASGDISIDTDASDSVAFSIKAPSGYLGSSYYVSMAVQHQDGSKTSTDNVAVTPTCSANLQAGVAIGPFNVTDVQADTHKAADDQPAVVLNNYGKGKAVFIPFDIVESALNRNMVEYAWMLKSAMNYILPQEAKPEAAGIALLETKVKLHGTGMGLRAVDTLGDGLTHLPLFSLTQKPLEYTFTLNDEEETAYRYFVRVKDKVGSYGKDTDIYLGINGGYSLFDKYQYNFIVDIDSDLYMQQAVAWVNEQLAAHPEAMDSLNTILNELVTIAFMPKLTAADMDKVIHQVVQTIHHINQLPFDTMRGREIMDGYLRVMEGEFK